MLITLNTKYRDTLAKVVELYGEGKPVNGLTDIVEIEVEPAAVLRQMEAVKESARVIELTIKRMRA